MALAATPRTSGPVAPIEGTRQSGSWRRTGVLVAAVFLMVGIILAVLAWSKSGGSSDAFRQGDIWGVTYSARREAMGTVYTSGLTTGDLPAVTLVSAKPLTTEGSAPAAIGVSYCKLPPGADGAVGVALGELAKSCSAVASVSGLDLAEIGRHRAILVVTVRPLAPGRVMVRGVEVTYRTHGKTHTQRIGPNFEIRP